jgi:hypothetical protein
MITRLESTIRWTSLLLAVFYVPDDVRRMAASIVRWGSLIAEKTTPRPSSYFKRGIWHQRFSY